MLQAGKPVTDTEEVLWQVELALKDAEIASLIGLAPWAEGELIIRRAIIFDDGAAYHLVAVLAASALHSAINVLRDGPDLRYATGNQVEHPCSAQILSALKSYFIFGRGGLNYSNWNRVLTIGYRQTTADFRRSPYPAGFSGFAVSVLRHTPLNDGRVPASSWSVTP